MDPSQNTAPAPARVLAYIPLPLCTARVHAGFPSPADDHADKGLDLSERFIRRPASSFIAQAEGDSMTGAAVLSGDYLVVDRSRDPRNGDVVLVVVDGDFAVKLFCHDRERIRLDSAHAGYPSIPWRDGCEVWGVVTSLHRDLSKPG